MNSTWCTLHANNTNCFLKVYSCLNDKNTCIRIVNFLRSLQQQVMYFVLVYYSKCIVINIHIFCRQRSCGKVMFSVVSVSLFKKRAPVLFKKGLLCRALALTVPALHRSPALSLDMFKFVQLRRHCTAPLPWDMIKRVHYEADFWKVGGEGWHLTKMLSCLNTSMLYIS